MEKKITLDIITPYGVIYSHPVSYVQVPTTAGLIGILADHAPLVSALTAGVITYRESDKKDRKAAISGGFIEVHDNKISIAASTAELAENIDLKRAKAAYERAQARLKTPAPDIDIERARAALYRAISRMRARN